MVKVRIEYKGQVKEFEKDAVIALFPSEESKHMVFVGRASTERAAETLSAGIPCILEQVSDSRMEYVSTMIDVHNKIGEKIKEELKAGGIHPLVYTLLKAMGGSSKNEHLSCKRKYHQPWQISGK